MHSIVTKYGDWIYRAIMFLLLCAVLWLNSHYVTRVDFDQLNKQVQGLDTTIKLMVEQNRVNDRQDDAIKDHEKRIRDLERMIPRGIP